MAIPNFAHKPIHFNEDGSIADIVYAPIDQETDFTVHAFNTEFERAKAVEDSNKAELSQLVFGDDRIESASDQEFGTFKRNFGRDVAQEQFNTYVAKKAGSLIHLIGQAAPEQVERHVLNKNRNAKTSAFKVNVSDDESQERKDRLNGQNNAVDAINEYHAETALMDEQGDTYLTGEHTEDTNVAGKLENLSEMQLAVIRAATGARPGDNDKILRSYKTFHAAAAMEEVGKVGIPNYVGLNATVGKELERQHQSVLDNLETSVDTEIADLGPGATREERKTVYQQAEERKIQAATAFQNAGTDARHVLSDLSSKAYEATQ